MAYSQVEKIHILGSGYKAELLGQIPAENLPVMFGGKCECEGGCPLSDAGPWKEEQYLKPSAPQVVPSATATATAAAPAPAAAPAEATATA